MISNVNFVRIFFTLLLGTLLFGCHPGIYNQQIVHQQRAISWTNAPIEDLLRIKGKPSSVYFLGDAKVGLVSSEYWTPEVERFETLYKPFGELRGFGADTKTIKQIYEKANRTGSWLFVYRTPVRGYVNGFRDCTEFYEVDQRATIINSGFLTNTLADHKHCLRPLPNLRKRH